VIADLLIGAVPVIFAITVHEAAHGYAAMQFGDSTAYLAGRVSLNPLRHIDPIGTLLLPLLMLVVSKLAGGPPLAFGWAKPVPVNYHQLQNPKQDMLWVAAAGPAANFAMIGFWALVVKLAMVWPHSAWASVLVQMGGDGVSINVIMLLLNLIPLPPLDGGRMALSLMPRTLSTQFARIEPYGLVLLVVLLFSRALNAIIEPLQRGALQMVAKVFGIYI
jgi:Zn-dependent protease